LFIVFEGPDGSGKGTQAALLHRAITSLGVDDDATLISFPRYENTISGKYIGDFLNGKFGDIAAVHPVLAAGLFALDRHESAEMLTLALSGNHVICDRFTASNWAHQAAKLPPSEQVEFGRWLKAVDMGTKCPEPDLTIYLRADLQTCMQLIAKKGKRVYTDKPDIHEADSQYMQKVIDLYEQWYSEADYSVCAVDVCDAFDNIRSKASIQDEIWKLTGLGA
jgi:dTMP kinase